MDALYNTILVLHILAAIVGFGGLDRPLDVQLQSARGSNAGQASALFDATLGVTNMAHYALYAVGPLGVILISLSEGAIEFSELWISLSFLTWFAMIGAAHALITKNLKATAVRAAELEASSAFRDDQPAVELLKKVALGDLVVQVVLVVSLGLMIWQPG